MSFLVKNFKRQNPVVSKMETTATKPLPQKVCDHPPKKNQTTKKDKHPKTKILAVYLFFIM